MYAEKNLKVIIKPGEGGMKEMIGMTFSFCMCVQQLFSALGFFFNMSDGEGLHLNILTNVPSHRQSDRSGKWSCFSEHVPREQTATAESGGRRCTPMWSPSDAPCTILLHW